jgi:hypothetical protein
VEQLEARNLLAAFTPIQLQHAYGFDQVPNFTGGIKADGTGQTVAIVDAFDDPTIAADLDKFSQTYGLPDSAHGLSFKKLTPQGTPAFDSGWALEMALDVEWVHAIAPKANIILVESLDNSDANLYAADVYAASQAATAAGFAPVTVVSNSWGGSEYSTETSDDANFSHTGVSFVFSAGDSGGRFAQYPSASPNVLSVGGTTLSLDANNNWSREVAWRLGGGGQSSYEAKPAFQSSITKLVRRGTPDVAYDADPNTGVSVYDTNNGGFLQVGGTSAGAPQWAALVAIANQGREANGKSAFNGGDLLTAIYTVSQSDYHDIKQGSNGNRAGTGYDLATGRGTPIANLLIPDLVAAAPATGAATAASMGSIKATALMRTRMALPTTPVTTAPSTPTPITAFDPSLANSAFINRTSTPQIQTVQPLTVATAAPTFAGANPLQSSSLRFNALLGGGSDRLSDDLDNAEPLSVMPASYEAGKPASAPAAPVDGSSAVTPMSYKAVDGFFMAPILAMDPTEASSAAPAAQEEEASFVGDLNAGMIGFVAFVGGSWTVRVAREEERRLAMRR